MKSVNKQLLEWKEMYQEIFGITLNISEIKIGEQKVGLDSLVVVVKGINLEKILGAMRKMVGYLNYLDNLNKIISTKSINKTYTIWVRKDYVGCITLEECLLLKTVQMWNSKNICEETRIRLTLQNWKKSKAAPIINNVVRSDIVTYSDLEEKMTAEKISRMVEIQKKEGLIAEIRKKNNLPPRKW